MFTRTRTRTLVAVSALLFGSSALVGVGFSGATWTHTTSTPVNVTASPDWTPPTASVATLPAGIFGTTTVTATAVDARSGIGSVTLEYAPAGGTTWTAITTGCTASSGTSPLVYSCQWATTGVPDGDYDVRARTTDTATPIAYSATSATVPTQVANSTSVVLTTVPDYVRGTISLTAGFLQPVSGNTRLYVDYLNGATWTQIGSCTAANVQSMNCSWDTTTFTNGTYELRARAENGNLTWTDEQSGVVVDNQAPTVTSFTVPAGVLSGSVLLAATATDALTSVASVSFDYQLGAGAWQSCGIDSTFPYSCNLDTTSLAVGSYTLRATAADTAGNTSAPATATRTVSNAAASVSIASPTANAVVSGAAFPVTASAASDRGVAQVRIDFRVANGTFATMCTVQTAPYSCDWNASGLPNGSYELRAVLTESSGGATLTSSTVGVTVNNSVGSVAVTSPLASGTVSGTTSVSATATPANGTTVTSVRYEAGPVGGPYVAACGPITTAPYTCSWNTSAITYAASYELRAIMLQGNLATVTSSITIAVNNLVASVSITSPTAGAVVEGKVVVAASASSNMGVTSVRIDARPAGGTFAPVCTDLVAPFTCDWDAFALANGSYEFVAVLNQGAAPALTSSVVAVTLTNRPLAAQDVQALNVLTPGLPAMGDKIVLTYSTVVDLTTIKAGWTGTQTGLGVTFNDKNVSAGRAISGDDWMSFTDTNLGQVALAQDFVASNPGTVTFTGSTMTAQRITIGSVEVTEVTVTLGTTTGTLSTKTTNGLMRWTPTTTVKALNGSACSSVFASESGTSDADF